MERILQTRLLKFKWNDETPDSLHKLQTKTGYKPVEKFDKKLKTLPAIIDLRSFFPPIYDQGNLGSCTAMSLAGAMHYDQNRQGLSSIVDPSRLFIYWNTRYIMGTVEEDSGASIADTILCSTTYGACKESTWPYILSKYRIQPSVEAYAESQQCVDLDGSELAEIPQNISTIKNVLSEGTPILFGIDVYTSFFYVGNDGIIPMPVLGRDRYQGGHALVLCGYDDTKQHFIVRNSWGVYWGDEGYGYMPYEYIRDSRLSGDFWSVSGIGAKSIINFEIDRPVYTPGENVSSDSMDAAFASIFAILVLVIVITGIILLRRRADN